MGLPTAGLDMRSPPMRPVMPVKRPWPKTVQMRMPRRSRPYISWYLAGGEVVDGLGHAVDVDGVGEVVLVDGALAEGVLDAVDGDGAGVDHALDTCPAGDLEHVVGALDVDV